MTRITVSVKVDETLAANIDKIAMESGLEKAHIYEQALELFKQLHTSKDTMAWLLKSAQESKLTPQQVILAILQMERFDNPRGVNIVSLTPKDDVERKIMERIQAEYMRSPQKKRGIPFEIWCSDEMAGHNLVEIEELISDEERNLYYQKARGNAQ